MKLKKVVAWGLALTMTLCLDVPGVNANSGGIETSLTKSTKDDQMDLVQKQKKLPGTKRTFFSDDSDIRDWFNVSGFAAEGVQDRSEYYDEYVANGKKNTKNYVVVKEDGYWKNGTKDYITKAAYEDLDESEQANYRFVTAEEQFTSAFDTRPRVIQVDAEELELGFHYLEDNHIPTGPIGQVSDYDSGSKQFAPVTNPVIMHIDDKYGILEANSDIRGTGVSDLALYSHLTIFSTTGCMLRHVGLDLSEKEDIIIRNFQFEGMYEWDDRTEEMCGHSEEAQEDGICMGVDFTTRKRYGWCYVSGSHSNNIWVDHCTFGYAFDGNLDLSNGCSFSATWCKFGVQDILDGKDENTHETPVTITMNGNTPVYSGTRWFESEGSELWKNILYMEEIYQGYRAGIVKEGNQYHLYTKYRKQGATPQELLRYAAMHSKVHLVGSGESSFYTNVDEKLSLGFNYYESIIQRVPMIRQGNGHMYNCIVDDSAFVANAKALSKKGVGIGRDEKGNLGQHLYTSGGCINARDGASVGADTCIFRDVRPINTGTEFQGPDNINATQWQRILSYVRNNQLIVNSSVQNSDDSEPYVGSSWDKDGVNKFIPSSFTYKDKSSIGDFHWAKWANQDEFAVYQERIGRLDGDEQKLWKWAEKEGWDAYAKQYYLGSDELGYDYQCFDLDDDMEEKVITYGGAQADLYGKDGTELDYIQPYNKAVMQESYGKKVTINTNGGELSNKVGNTYYIEHGKSITLPTAKEISRTGYTFVGWRKGTYNADGELEYGEYLAEPDKAATVSAATSGYEEETYYADWKITTYKVTFDSMGGSAVDTVLEAEYNQTISAIGGLPKENPTKDGATFVGWFRYTPETQTYGTKVTATARVTGNMTLYAKWNNTINFDTDGAGEIATKKVESGKTIGNVANPEKEGFTFVGWFSDEAKTKAFDPKTDIVMEPMTLYAKFRANDQPVVTVSFETGLEDVTMPSVEIELGVTGSAISLDPPVPEDDTLEFEGWYMDAEHTVPFNPEAEITEDITLYANWTRKTVFVLGDLNGSGEPDTDDALAILKHTAGAELIVDPAMVAIADINESGEPDTDDALAILRYVAGGEL